MRTRPYQLGDEKKILALYEEVNGRPMPEEYWRWRYEMCPAGSGIVQLLFAGERLVGHYAVSPALARIDGEVVRGALSLHTMTHPDYQRRGVFRHLAEEVYDRCEKERFEFVYGFPNENSYHGFTAKLGWVSFGRMVCLRKEIDGDIASLPTHEGVLEVQRFDARVDQLASAARAGGCIRFLRDRPYLTWRYVKHPSVRYRILTYEAAGELLGYAVLKVYEAAGLRRGHLVELVTADEVSAAEVLVEQAEAALARLRAGSVSCWDPDSPLVARVLASRGYAIDEFDCYFGVRSLTPVLARRAALTTRDQWRVCMGDSDIF